MPTEILYTFFVACLLLIITPGPDLLFVVSQSIARGKKYGIAVTLGQLGGLVFHLTLFAFGVSALISRSTYLFQTVKIAGALYLFWLAYNVFKSDNVIVIDQGVGGSGSFLGFMRKGLFMNILNPKVMMFFLAFFPGFISEEAGSVTRQVWILGMIFVTQTLVVFSTISIIASQLTDVIKNNTIVHTFLKWMQIVVFTLLGIYILW